MKKRITFWAMGLVVFSMVNGCRKTEKQAELLDLRPLVRVGQLTPAYAFTDGVQVQGAVRTKFSAAVSARVSGAIDAVMADEGDLVTRGQPLFQVDKVTLENRVRLAQDDLSVAQAALKESDAARLETEASYAKAEVDASRLKKLYEEAKAVTKDTWEKADLQFKLTGATRERARAAVESANVRIAQAETALSVVRKNLSDALGVAPFDGVITRKILDKGDFANVGTAVFEMDDPRLYEVCFSMNAVHYDRVKTGQTQVRFADGKEAVVTYKAPLVHPVTRTFEIRVALGLTPDLASGMLRDATVVFRKVEAAALPVSAVGLRDGAHVVFVVKDGKVALVPVDAGLTWQSYIEIKNPNALADANIVVEGMLLLNKGDVVRTEK